MPSRDQSHNKRNSFYKWNGKPYVSMTDCFPHIEGIKRQKKGSGDWRESSMVKDLFLRNSIEGLFAQILDFLNEFHQAKTSFHKY